jgi:hypothetical protein
MKRVLICTLFLAVVLVYGIPALDIEGEWEFHSAVVAVERSIADEMGAPGDPMIEQHSLLYYDGEGESVVFTITPETRTLLWDGDPLPYRRVGDAYTAESPEGRFELLFTALGDEIFCQINFSSDYGRYILVGEIRKPGEAAIGRGTIPLELAGKRFVNSSSDIALEFRETMVKISIIGVQSGSFKYEVEGDYIYIFDPDAGAVEFEIVEEDTLYTDEYGLAGYYDLE